MIPPFVVAARRPMRLGLANEAGNALVQFALVIPAFVMLIFGVIEIGRGLWLQNALHYATEQAARCASVNSSVCGDNSSVGSYGASVSGANIPAAAFSLDDTQICGNLVKAQYTINLNIPYRPMTWTLSAQSCFPK